MSADAKKHDGMIKYVSRKLKSYITRAEHCWHHKWRVGDVVMWDNRCTLHRRDEFDAGARRIMHRSQIKGGRMAA